MHTTNVNDLGLTDASCTCDSHSDHGESTTALPRDASTATYRVTGMTCSHCVASVTAEVGKLAGPENVTVALVPGGVSVVTVSSAAPIDAAAVAAAIDEAGYELVPASS